MRWLTVVLALVSFSGCTAAFDVTGREWQKAGADLPQVTLDETECARNAFDAGDTPDLILGGLLDVGRLIVENSTQARTYRDCMTSRGYERREG